MGASLATVRKHLDAIGAAVSAIAPVSVPEPAPTYDDFKARFEPLVGRFGFTRDDTSGFDEPIRQKTKNGVIRRPNEPR
jgi:hypothetical protein